MRARGFAPQPPQSPQAPQPPHLAALPQPAAPGGASVALEAPAPGGAMGGAMGGTARPFDGAAIEMLRLTLTLTLTLALTQP